MSDKPTEQPEGIIIREGGQKITDAVSTTEVEVLDLICEGPIEGLVESEIEFVGTEGNVGWDSYTPTYYENAPGTVGTKWLRSIYLNQVPVVDSANKYNFQRIDISQSKGEPNGSILLGSSLYELNISRAINERLRASTLDGSGNVNKDFTKIYRIYNKDCKGAFVNVRTQRLSSTDSETGDISTTFVDYKIYYRPFFSNPNKTYSGIKPEQKGFFDPISEKIEGKLQGPYIRSTRIDFPDGPINEPDFVGWEIKIVRLTKDSISVYLSNQTYVDSLTEIYTNVFCYPYSAIIRSRYDAEFFASVPQRSFDVKLLKVKVPKNYNPIKKSYDTTGAGTTNGVWNGEFSDTLQWTDNPAWCFYDLITNKRYGLGEYIDADHVDKFSLYQIARYCDTLVPDGYGGLEPRFTCNLILYTREDAYKVLNDFASIFNAMVYYANGLIYVSQDRPKNPIIFFNNSSVENGNFTYSSSSKKARATIAIVRYNDPKNYYKPALEYVQNVEGIRRYGTRTIEVAAFGCTSKGQAARLGHWMLISELYEPETVTFVAGTEASYLRPGDIFGVYDRNRKSYRNSGRLISILVNLTSTTAVIDGTVNLESGKAYYFKLVTPSYNYDSSQVSDLNAGDESEIRKEFIQTLEITDANVSINSNNQTVITVNTPLNTTDYTVAENQIWVIEQKESLDTVNTLDEYNRSIDSDYDLFRAIRISETPDGKYEIGGVQYVESKFEAITQSISFERDDAVVFKIPDGPKEIQLSTNNVTTNSKTIRYVIVPPDNQASITSYKIFVSTEPFSSTDVPDNIYLAQTIPAVSNPAGNFSPQENGNTYYFRVYSFNDEGRVYSPTYVYDSIFMPEVEAIKDVQVVTLSINNASAASTLSSTLIETYQATELNPLFNWQGGILNESAQAPDDIQYRVTIREPQTGQPTPSNKIYYEVTGLTSPYYKFDFATNASLTGGPYRNYEVVVEAYDPKFRTSAGNIISPDDQYNENGWYNNPNGYSRIYVYTDPISYTSLNNFTGSFGRVADSGKSYQYIDTNGGVIFLFAENTISTGIVGGVIYASTGFFTPSDAAAKRSDIVMRRFNYSSLERYAYAPAVFNPYLPYYTGWAAISFYDTFDREYIAKNPDYITGINITNAYPVYCTGMAHSFEIKKELKFVNTGNYNDSIKISTSNHSGSGAYRLSMNKNGYDVILASFLP